MSACYYINSKCKRLSFLDVYSKDNQFINILNEFLVLLHFPAVDVVDMKFIYYAKSTLQFVWFSSNRFHSDTKR